MEHRPVFVALLDLVVVGFEAVVHLVVDADA